METLCLDAFAKSRSAQSATTATKWLECFEARFGQDKTAAHAMTRGDWDKKASATLQLFCRDICKDMILFDRGRFRV